MSFEASKLLAVSSPLQKRPAPKNAGSVGGMSDAVLNSSGSSSEVKYLSRASVDEHGQPLYPEVCIVVAISLLIASD